MNFLILFLYALVIRAEHDDIFPARILAQQKTLSENSALYLKCSTFGYKKHTAVFVYLCLNDIGVDKQSQKAEEDDTTFFIHKVSLQHSGSYSCVFSENDYLPSAVNARGGNLIEILVIANFHPANISLSDPSSVNHGDHVELLCMVSDLLQTLGECDLIQSYLMHDRTIIQVQAFDVKEMKANFAVRDATQRDSGHYSCLVLPSQCFQEDEDRINGKNEVILRVRERAPFELTVPLIVVSVMLFLSVVFWAIYKADLCASCAKRPQTNADNTEEPPRPTERGGEDFEAQEDSFDNEYQNLGCTANLVYAFDVVPVYDEVLSSEDLSEENPSAPYYAKSSKHKCLRVK